MQNEIYDLVVDITNTSPRPALYTSLELFAGGGVYLVDQNGHPLTDGSKPQSFGHIQPGATVSASFRVKSKLEGEILACQGIASDNITLTVETGPEGTACNIVNTLPANVVPLAPNLAPVVFGINPLNGQPGIPITSTVEVILSPASACLSADTWQNFKVENGFLVDGTLLSPGSVYMEELDDNGNPVGRVAVDLVQVTPPAGGTTIVTLRPGLDNNQLRLNPGKQYRVTLRGGAGGICSASSGREMQNDFVFSFFTAQTCDALSPPKVVSISPLNGAINQGVKTPIVVQFDKPMDPMTFNPISVWVTQNALESDGDIFSGTPVLSAQIFSYQNRQLSILPLAGLAAGAQVHVRLLNTLKDTCGNPLQTPPNGIWLSKFTIKAATDSPTTPPDGPVLTPSLNPIAPFTNQTSVEVSGRAQANSVIWVLGGAQPVSAQTNSAGLFSLPVLLNLNQANQLQVLAVIGSTQSLPVLLNITQDSIPPEVLSIIPAIAASGVPRNAAIQINFKEAINPSRVNLLNIELLQGVVPVLGNVSLTAANQITFTPRKALDYSTEYQLRLPANGLQDLAGNPLANEVISLLTTQDMPPPQLTSVSPSQGPQGSSLKVVLTGQQLATASSLTSPNPGITGAINSVSETRVEATLSIAADAPLGTTSLKLTTSKGSAGISFTVLDKAPDITGMTPSVGAMGSRYTAAISGTSLGSVRSISVDGTGVEVIGFNTRNTTSNAFDVLIEVGIASDAPLGNRTLTLTTPSGQSTTTLKVIKPELIPTNTWINPNGGDWNTASNWSKNAVPTKSDVVSIASAGPVTLTGTVKVNAMTVYSTLVVSGNLNLNGTGVAKALEVAAGGDIRINTSSTLLVQNDVQNDGSILLKYTECCYRYSTLQVNDSVISGNGTIDLGHSYTRLESIGTMGFGPELKITGKGGIVSGVIDNAGGLLRINENDDEVSTSATLKNLVISADSNLLAAGGVIDKGVTIEGILTIPSNVTVKAIADVTVNGSILLKYTECCYRYSTLQVNDSVISGNGTIDLGHSYTRLESIGTMGFGPELKITGKGGIVSGVIDNAGGLLRINENDDEVSTSATLKNLVISADSNLLAAGGVIDKGVTIEGILTIPSNVTVKAIADVTVNGSILLKYTECCYRYSTLQVNDSVISGSGTIQLNDATAVVEPITNGTLTLDSTLTLTGQGSLGGAGSVVNFGTIISDTGTLNVSGLTNNGLLQVNSSRKLNLPNSLLNNGEILVKAGGLVKVTGDYTQSPAGTLSIDLTSNSTGTLTVDKTANLAGTLNMELTSPTPPASKSITFMTFGSSTGEFTTLNLAPNFSLVKSPQKALMFTH